MAFIYKITNDINDKVYIGMTTRDVTIRWKEHLRRSSQLIDSTIQELGKEHFSIETIEECSDEEVDDREIYWINFYDSFKNGYNVTLGGRDEKLIMTDKVNEVLEWWHKGLTINKIVKETGLNVETVRGYLNKNGINHEQIRERANIYIGKSKAKPVGQYDLNGELVRVWESQAQIVREKKYTRSTLQRAIYNNKVLDNHYWRTENI